MAKRKKSSKPKLFKETPKAKCCRCLQWIDLDEYFKNDYYCDECAVKHNAEMDGTDKHPLASEPHFEMFCPKDSK